MLVDEDRLDCKFKQATDLKSERKARIEPASFERVDRLARNVELISQGTLRPIPSKAKLFETILHRRLDPKHPNAPQVNMPTRNGTHEVNRGFTAKPADVVSAMKTDATIVTANAIANER